MERQTIQALPPEHRHWIGMRIIKTVVAVFLCGLLAFFREASGFYSMIAAVVCIQNSAGKTIESSVNRMTGTLIGGVAGVLVVYSLDTLNVLYIELLRYAVLAVMLIPIIKLCLAIKKPGCAAMACIVFLCVTVNHSIGDTPAIYSIDRLFETLVGVALACGIDILLPYQPMPSPPEEENAAPEQEGQPQEESAAPKQEGQSPEENTAPEQEGQPQEESAAPEREGQPQDAPSGEAEEEK